MPASGSDGTGRLGARVPMTAELLLGLDLGTTHAKAAVVTVDGRERALGSAPTPWRTLATRAALAAAPEGRVIGVGVTSMAETGALLDREGEPVTPMIAWHDTRGDEQAGELARAVGPQWFARRAGLPMSRLCTASKYRWLRAHLPGAKEGVRWLNVAEWLLGGPGGG